MTKIFNFQNTYVDLPPSFYRNQNPEPVSLPQLKMLNISLCKELGIDSEAFKALEGIKILAGNEIAVGSRPIAQAYCGHQFGYFTMLGDGRAVLLGEQITPKGERIDIALKGSGKTPFSRGGDGRAALGPMIREYIISEAMHNLGIPTTRSLAVVTTGEKVIREELLPGAILTRTASSHLRVGTFQYAAFHGDSEDVKLLADYALTRHFKHWADVENRYEYLLDSVVKRQAELIASWQLIGFIHGVMNTDNMSISGETIDYGPCAFMDTYDPDTVFSSIDVNGRYSYKNQPTMGAWNLARFAESIILILNEDEKTAIRYAEGALKDFNKFYRLNYLYGMRKKIGLFNAEEYDELLINDLLSLMHKYKADYTNTFRSLSLDKLEELPMYGTDDFNKWLERWSDRLSRQSETKEESLERMRKSNPAVIPRNHRVEEALKMAVEQDDYTLVNKLLDVLKNPYEYSKDQEEYSKLPPPSCSPYRTFCGT